MADQRKVKRLSVSSKRQISIPKEFFDTLQIGNEVVMEMMGNRLVIRPIREDFGDFSDLILEELITEGYEGQELMQEFKARKTNISPALEALIEEAKHQPPTTVEELFGDDEDDQ